MSASKRWQDWALVVLGVILFVAPFLFGAMASVSAAWTAYIGGALMVVFGVVNLANPAFLAGEWIEGVLGVLVFLAPWLLAFSALGAIAWSAWIVGVLAVLLAGSVLFGSTEQTAAVSAQH
jgi:uncharacterized membrane protein HdeD (DUF308 family)